MDELAGQCSVVVDATGVGAPVVDLLNRAQLSGRLYPVTITGGERERESGGIWNIPKRDLIAGVEMALEKLQLRIARNLRDEGSLVRELMDVETERLLTHWRTYTFNGIRPFFCQIEAVEIATWLTGVAPKIGKTGDRLLEYLKNADHEPNPELFRLAPKLATGAGKTAVIDMLIARQTNPTLAGRPMWRAEQQHFQLTTSFSRILPKILSNEALLTLGG
jgi:hypothetical protein